MQNVRVHGTTSNDADASLQYATFSFDCIACGGSTTTTVWLHPSTLPFSRNALKLLCACNPASLVDHHPWLRGDTYTRKNKAPEFTRIEFTDDNGRDRVVRLQPGYTCEYTPHRERNNQFHGFFNATRMTVAGNGRLTVDDAVPVLNLTLRLLKENDVCSADVLTFERAGDGDVVQEVHAGMRFSFF